MLVSTASIQVAFITIWQNYELCDHQNHFQVHICSTGFLIK